MYSGSFCGADRAPRHNPSAVFGPRKMGCARDQRCVTSKRAGRLVAPILRHGLRRAPQKNAAASYESPNGRPLKTRAGKSKEGFRQISAQEEQRHKQIVFTVEAS